MNDYAFAAPPVVALASKSTKPFPVRRIFCVGQNYSEHAREMGGDPEAEPPFFFTKPADAILQNRSVMPYPPGTFDLQHEVELVVAFDRGGRDIDPERVDELIFGYAVGLDMTRRDLQAAAKKKGRPWDMSKAFDFSAPCAAITPKAEIGAARQGRDRMQSERRAPSIRGSTRHDLESSANRPAPFRARRNKTGGSRFHRYAGRRRPGVQRRRHRGDDRRPGAADDPDRLARPAPIAHFGHCSSASV